MLKRTLLVIAVTVITAFVTFLLIYRNVIFQEGNPIPIIKGIVKLNLTNNDVVKVSDKSERYIEKSKSGHQPFIKLMMNDGYTFNEQIGSGLIFEKGGSMVIATIKMYTRYYEVINVSRDSEKYIRDSVPLKEGLPNDFGMVFQYGGDAKNKLDTFNGKYTKDLILDPNITVDFKLTKRQLQIIYNKMKEIGFFDYPDNYIPNSNSYVTPFQTYYFKVMANNSMKELRWEDKHFSEDVKAKNLRELIQLITIMIQDSPEYKTLPTPRGGYD